MSFLSAVQDVTIISSEFNSDLAKITEWDFNWNMSFNPDPSKPAQEAIFHRKLKAVPCPSIAVNKSPLNICSAQKHLGLVLDLKLTFKEHINHILSIVNKMYRVNP